MPGSTQLSTADRLSIMELLARYARCLDSGDLDGYVDNFAPDGVAGYLNPEPLPAWPAETDDLIN